MSQTIKEATVKRFPYESRDQFRTRLADFVVGCSFDYRFKAHNSIEPRRNIPKSGTSGTGQIIVALIC